MKSFAVPDADPATFVKRVRAEIASHGLEGIASIDVKDDQLEVRISQFGTSRVVYKIEPTGAGFRARLTGESIAPMHRALLPTLEGKLNEVLKRVGATIEA